MITYERPPHLPLFSVAPAVPETTPALELLKSLGYEVPAPTVELKIYHSFLCHAVTGEVTKYRWMDILYDPAITEISCT